MTSLCHTNWFYAVQGYSDDATPHDSIVSALFTFGEGYHNYHHAFAQDYRNGFKWYYWDPTKWYVYCCYKLNFCWDLKRTPDSIIQRARNEVRTKKLRAELEELTQESADIHPVITEVMTVEEVQRLVKEEGRRLIMVEGYVVDLDKPIKLEGSRTHEESLIHWYDTHPGGRAFLDLYIGRDATDAMNGGVYKHTHGARCTIPELYIARLKQKA